MPYRDFSKITFKIKRGGSTMTSSYCGEVWDLRNPRTRRRPARWSRPESKKYPGYDIVDLEVELR